MSFPLVIKQKRPDAFHQKYMYLQFIMFTYIFRFSSLGDDGRLCMGSNKKNKTKQFHSNRGVFFYNDLEVWDFPVSIAKINFFFFFFVFFVSFKISWLKVPRIDVNQHEDQISGRMLYKVHGLGFFCFFCFFLWVCWPVSPFVIIPTFFVQ